MRLYKQVQADEVAKLLVETSGSVEVVVGASVGTPSQSKRSTSRCLGAIGLAAT